MVFSAKTGRLTSLKVSLAQNFFSFKISKASVPEAHSRVRNTGRVKRKEQEKYYYKLVRASAEREAFLRQDFTSLRECWCILIYNVMLIYALTLETWS